MLHIFCNNSQQDNPWNNCRWISSCWEKSPPAQNPSTMQPASVRHPGENNSITWSKSHHQKIIHAILRFVQPNLESKFNLLEVFSQTFVPQKFVESAKNLKRLPCCRWHTAGLVWKFPEQTWEHSTFYILHDRQREREREREREWLFTFISKVLSILCNNFHFHF